MNTTDLILTIMYFTSVAGSVVFVGRYVWTRWWRTPEGRWIMGLHGSLAYFGFLTFMRLMWGPQYPFRFIAPIIGFVLLASSTWGLTFLLFRAQRRGRLALIAEPESKSKPDLDPELDHFN